MEIVSEPSMRSPEEARQYLVKLRTILRYLKVSTANMEEGSFRCDANISIREMGDDELGAKVEVKNMNSFRAVFRALQYEIERQSKVLDEGGRIVQETRGWLEEESTTVSQRSKEFAHDYRYFPEPDLLPLVVSRKWVAEVESTMPELPDSRAKRYVDQLGISQYKAEQLTLNTSATSDYFDAAIIGSNALTNDERQASAGIVCNLVLGDVMRLFNGIGSELDTRRLNPSHVLEVATMLESRQLSTNMASEVLDALFESPDKTPNMVVEVNEAIESNPQAVEDYFRGKESAVKFLVGQVMKSTKGQANPVLATEAIQEKLKTLGKT